MTEHNKSNWRPLHPPRRPGGRFGKPVRLGLAADPIVHKCLKRHGPLFGSIAKDWRYIAGEAANWTLPLAIKSTGSGTKSASVLVIATSSAHALLLQMHSPDIIARANTRLGYAAIERIVIDQSGHALA